MSTKERGSVGQALKMLSLRFFHISHSTVANNSSLGRDVWLSLDDLHRGGTTGQCCRDTTRSLTRVRNWERDSRQSTVAYSPESPHMSGHRFAVAEAVEASSGGCRLAFEAEARISSFHHWWELKWMSLFAKVRQPDSKGH
ncbi:hypothetical protein NL676_016107 [Syzygium grande]|nr:hypothetical protein NL676_016107 [Syzygium grande]